MTKTNNNWNTSSEDKQPTFNTGIDLADKYLQTCAGTEITVSSAKSYESHLRGFGRYCDGHDIRVTRSSVVDVKEFYRELVRRNLSSKTISAYKTAINNLYRFIRVETDRKSQIDLITLLDLDISSWNTREIPEPEPLTEDELKKLISNASNKRNKLMISVAGETGARNESLRKIKTRDVDLAKRKIELRNTKCNRDYIIPISSELSLELRRWLEIEREQTYVECDSDYLFPSNYGEFIQTNKIFCDIVQDAAEKAGIQKIIDEREPTEAEKDNNSTKGTVKQWRVNAHTLRRTFSHLLNKAGLNTKQRRDALDHESIETTEKHYTFEESDYEDVMRQAFHES